MKNINRRIEQLNFREINAIQSNRKYIPFIIKLQNLKITFNTLMLNYLCIRQSSYVEKNPDEIIVFLILSVTSDHCILYVCNLKIFNLFIRFFKNK